MTQTNFSSAFFHWLHPSQAARQFQSILQERDRFAEELKRLYADVRKLEEQKHEFQKQDDKSRTMQTRILELEEQLRKTQSQITQPPIAALPLNEQCRINEELRQALSVQEKTLQEQSETLRKHTQTISVQQGEIAQQSQSLAQKDQIIAARAQEVQNHRITINTLNEQIVKLDQDLQLQENTITAQKEEIAKRDNLLADKDQIIAKLNMDLSSLQTELAGCRQTLQKQTADLQSLNERNSLLQTEIGKWKDALAQRDHMIESQKLTIAHHEETIAGKDSLIQQQASEFGEAEAGLNRKVEEQEKELKAVAGERDSFRRMAQERLNLLKKFCSDEVFEKFGNSIPANANERLFMLLLSEFAAMREIRQERIFFAFQRLDALIYSLLKDTPNELQEKRNNYTELINRILEPNYRIEWPLRGTNINDNPGIYKCLNKDGGEIVDTVESAVVYDRENDSVLSCAEVTVK